MERITIKHCSLPINSPATCEDLREVPIKEGNDFVSFCARDEKDCPFAVPVEHELPGFPVEKDKD